MYPPETFQALLTTLAELLRSNGIRFHLTGGLVSAWYNEPRYTQDADLVVDQRRITSAIDELLQAFRQRGYLFHEPSVRDAVRQGRMFQIYDQQESLKADIYPGELVAGELDRSQEIEIFPGTTLPIVSRADLAVAKLIWIRRGSHRSRRDLRRILRQATDEEREFIDTQAQDRSLSDLLTEVLAEPDEVDG